MSITQQITFYFKFSCIFYSINVTLQQLATYKHIKSSQTIKNKKTCQKAIQQTH